MVKESGEGIEIQIEDGPAERVLRVTGTLSLLTAERLLSILLAGLRTGAKTVLEAAALDQVDLCGLQLLCSAHRTYSLHDACFELRPMPEAVQIAARAAGYRADTSVCPCRRDGNCLWKG